MVTAHGLAVFAVECQELAGLERRTVFTNARISGLPVIRERPCGITVPVLSQIAEDTLIFVRCNDILLQCGMALQAIPLPSLGVSSLDLGRSFNRTAPFF